MKRYTNEVGLSMTEMLGVLAVIGVLSLGSIQGYKYAMDKYKANETMNDIAQRKTDLLRQMSFEQKPNLSEWPEKGVFYPITLRYDDELTTYAMDVSYVPEKVCQMISREMIHDFTIKIGENSYEKNADNIICAESNLMSFYFDETEMPIVPPYDKCGNTYCDKSKPYCKEGKTCVECLSDDHCAENELCFPDANNVCWKYSTEPIDSTGWVQLKLNNTYAVRWVDANRVCASLGKRLPSTSELVEGWDGITLCPEDGLCVTSTSLGNTFREKMSYRGVIWTSDVRIAPWTGYRITYYLSNGGLYNTHKDATNGYGIQAFCY